MSDARVAFWAVFAGVAGIVYVAAMENNWAAFTYHPRLVEFAWGVERPKSGPAMYWYGWMTTSALCGLAAGAVAALAARRIGRSFWFAAGWVVPAGAMLAAIYFMLPFVTR
jgi:hypothetical protein